MFSYTDREPRQVATLNRPRSPSPLHSFTSSSPYQHHSAHSGSYDTSQHYQIPSSSTRPYNFSSTLSTSATPNPLLSEEFGWFDNQHPFAADNNAKSSFDTTPTPIYVPPIPASMQDMLSDQFIAEQPSWGPFVPSVTPSSAAETYPGPASNLPGHTSKDHTLPSWSMHQPLPTAPFHDNHSGNHFGGNVNHIFPNEQNTNTHTPSYSSYVQPPSYDGMFGMFPGSRKGKERAMGSGDDIGRELKKSRMDGHNEFDKDIALLQGYLSDLIGLLQPFATSSSQPNPPKPPPYLHTRFLRLTSSVQQTLTNLAPVSHPHLASASSNAPSRNSKGVPSDPQSTAEKEMDLIRKRRDWLIAKAAQSKAVNTPTPTQGYSSGAASPSLDSTPSHIFHPSGSYHGLDNDGHSALSYGTAGMIVGDQPDSASLAYERNYPGHMIGRTVENPSGRCHSCGIQGAIEWRRGPDGARTLCDSCGEHYARLSRQQPTPLTPPLSHQQDLT